MGHLWRGEIRMYHALIKSHSLVSRDLTKNQVQGCRRTRHQKVPHLSTSTTRNHYCFNLLSNSWKSMKKKLHGASVILKITGGKGKGKGKRGRRSTAVLTQVIFVCQSWGGNKQLNNAGQCCSDCPGVNLIKVKYCQVHLHSYKVLVYCALIEKICFDEAINLVKDSCTTVF